MFLAIVLHGTEAPCLAAISWAAVPTVGTRVAWVLGVSLPRLGLLVLGGEVLLGPPPPELLHLPLLSHLLVLSCPCPQGYSSLRAVWRALRRA